jgi:hypothetical protein
MPARAAFEWWSKATGVDLLIDWEALARDGINPQKPISLNLRHVLADRALILLLKQAATEDQTLIAEPDSQYVQISTKSFANHHPVTRVYDVADLVMDIPNFDNVPMMDLAAVLSQRPGQNGSSGNSILGNNSAGGTSAVLSGKTADERGEDLANLIRSTIEPTIWVENGGSDCSIKYYRGKLVVRAPQYVQVQIGTPLPIGH